MYLQDWEVALVVIGCLLLAGGVVAVSLVGTGVVSQPPHKFVISSITDEAGASKNGGYLGTYSTVNSETAVGVADVTTLWRQEESNKHYIALHRTSTGWQLRGVKIIDDDTQSYDLNTVIGSSDVMSAFTTPVSFDGQWQSGQASQPARYLTAVAV